MHAWIAEMVPYLARALPLIKLWDDTLAGGAGSWPATLARLAAIERHVAHLHPPLVLEDVHRRMLGAMTMLHVALRAPACDFAADLEAARTATEAYTAALHAVIAQLPAPQIRIVGARDRDTENAATIPPPRRGDEQSDTSSHQG
jgi:hypothetical protein